MATENGERERRGYTTREELSHEGSSARAQAAVAMGVAVATQLVNACMLRPVIKVYAYLSDDGRIQEEGLTAMSSRPQNEYKSRRLPTEPTRRCRRVPEPRGERLHQK